MPGTKAQFSLRTGALDLHPPDESLTVAEKAKSRSECVRVHTWTGIISGHYLFAYEVRPLFASGSPTEQLPQVPVEMVRVASGMYLISNC